MMRAILTTLGVLIGTVAELFGMWHVYCHGRTPIMDAGLEAFFLSLFIGAPIGAVTFGVIGFWLGYRLDKKAKQRQLDEENSELEA